MTAYILQCPDCGRTHDWDSKNRPQGVGFCFCKRGRWRENNNVTQMFRVVKQHMPVGGVWLLQEQGPPKKIR